MKNLFTILLVTLSFNFTNAQGPLHTCYHFNGTNSEIEIQNISGFLNYPSLTQFTVQMWVYFPNSPASATSDIAFLIPADTTGLRIGLNHNTLGVEVGLNNGTTDASFNTPLSAFGNTNSDWYNITITYDGPANGNFKCYINGQYTGTSTGWINTHFTSTTYTIGANSVAQGIGPFEYYLDDFRVWNTALDSNTIINNICGELQGTESGLLMYYKLNEVNTAHTAADATGNHNDGANTNFNLTSPSSIPCNYAPSIGHTCATCAAAIDDAVNVEALKIYPNPAGNEVTVQSAIFTLPNIYTSVYDATGQKVNVTYTIEGNKITFNTSALNNGCYFIKCTAGGQTFNGNFVKLQ
jgi:hypothetical protein